MGALYSIVTKKLTPAEYEKEVVAIHNAISRGEIEPRDGFNMTGKLFHDQVNSSRRTSVSVSAR